MSSSDQERAIDRHVGARLRDLRIHRGLSQQALSVPLSLTFQQVQKMERGTNRIGAGRLHQLAKVLEVPVDYFYDDLPVELAGAPDPLKRRDADAAAYDPGPGYGAKRETLELVRRYYRLPEYARAAVYRLIKQLGKGSEHERPKPDDLAA